MLIKYIFCQSDVHIILVFVRIYQLCCNFFNVAIFTLFDRKQVNIIIVITVIDIIIIKRYNRYYI